MGMSFWKKARLTAEVATTAALPAPNQQAILQQTHLEPAMTQTELRQEIQQEEQSEAANLYKLDYERQVDRATSNPGPTIDRAGSANPPGASNPRSPRQTVRSESQRAEAERPRSEPPKASRARSRER
jgi:hypothetical protein